MVATDERTSPRANPPRRRSRRRAPRDRRARFRAVLRRAGSCCRYGLARAHRDVGDHLRGVRTVRGCLDPGHRRQRDLRDHRSTPAERSVRPDRGQRRTPPHRQRLVPPLARRTDGRRNLGGRRRGRRTVQSPRPPGGRGHPLPRVGARHDPGCRLRRRDRRPVEVGTGRRVPRPLPRTPRPATHHSAGVGSRDPGRRDRPRAHAVHPRGRADHRRERRLPAGPSRRVEGRA